MFFDLVMRRDQISYQRFSNPFQDYIRLEITGDLYDEFKKNYIFYKKLCGNKHYYIRIFSPEGKLLRMFYTENWDIEFIWDGIDRAKIFIIIRLKF